MNTSTYTSFDQKIEEQLIENRMIMINQGIDSDVAESVIKRLWYAEFSNNTRPITILINTPGGSIDAGLAIWDQARLLKSPLITVVTGMAASMGTILNLMAPKGSRFITRNSRMMIHQPSIHGVIRGQATDLHIQAEEIKQTKIDSFKYMLMKQDTMPT